MRRDLLHVGLGVALTLFVEWWLLGVPYDVLNRAIAWLGWWS